MTSPPLYAFLLADASKNLPIFDRQMSTVVGNYKEVVG
jgi:hypothetical protein